MRQRPRCVPKTTQDSRQLTVSLPWSSSLCEEWVAECPCCPQHRVPYPSTSPSWPAAHGPCSQDQSQEHWHQRSRHRDSRSRACHALRQTGLWLPCEHGRPSVKTLLQRDDKSSLCGALLCRTRCRCTFASLWFW